MKQYVLAAFPLLAACGPSPQQIAAEIRESAAQAAAQQTMRERQRSYYPNERERLIVKIAAEGISPDPHNTFVRLISLRRNSADDAHFDFCAESYRRNSVGYVDQVRWIFGEYRGDASIRATASGEPARLLCRAKIEGPTVTHTPRNVGDGWHRPGVSAVP